MTAKEHVQAVLADAKKLDKDEAIDFMLYILEELDSKYLDFWDEDEGDE